MTKLRGTLTHLFELVFRWIRVPVEPGLIEFGNPDENSPVFLTCNYDLTVRRVSKYLKNLDCYLLVAPTRGINVWCASCGGDFNAHSVISVIKITDISSKVKHRTIIAPQLSAPGIDVKKVKDETGWNIVFGPVYAKYIPEYVRNGFKKTEKMRKVKFTVRDRLEMASTYFFSLAVFLISILFALAFMLPNVVTGSTLSWILQMVFLLGL